MLATDCLSTQHTPLYNTQLSSYYLAMYLIEEKNAATGSLSTRHTSLHNFYPAI
jgi:hypothetical protein